MADSTHPHYSDDDVINVETRHEESDVNVRGLIAFVVVFIIFAVVTHVGLWLLYRFYVNIGKGATANAPLSAVAAPPNMSVPDLPRLQPFPTKVSKDETNAPYTNTPVTDMSDMAGAQNAKLNGYSWVDQGRGVVRIPIEEAKKLALSNGTYKTAAAAAQTTAAPAGAPALQTQPATATQQLSNSATSSQPASPTHP
jgi:cytoskeletal protein RodZ